MAKTIPFPGKTWGKFIARNLAQAMKRQIDAFDRAELEALILTCKQFTGTNCGWVEYQCKDAIINLCRSRLEMITPSSQLKKRKTP